MLKSLAALLTGYVDSVRRVQSDAILVPSYPRYRIAIYLAGNRYFPADGEEPLGSGDVCVHRRWIKNKMEECEKV